MHFPNQFRASQLHDRSVACVFRSYYRRVISKIQYVAFGVRWGSLSIPGRQKADKKGWRRAPHVNVKRCGLPSKKPPRTCWISTPAHTLRNQTDAIQNKKRPWQSYALIRINRNPVISFRRNKLHTYIFMDISLLYKKLNFAETRKVFVFTSSNHFSWLWKHRITHI